MKALKVLLILLICTLALAVHARENALIEQALFKFRALEKYNGANERHQRDSKNEYIILLDRDWRLSPNWIEEQGNATKVLGGRYESLSKMLKDFNDVRKDDLRFYVIVVNDYQVLLNETLDPAQLPEHVTNLRDLVKLPDVNEQYARFKKEISNIPASIAAAMAKAGYTNRVIYFFSLIKLYKLDKKQRTYRYDNLNLLGDNLKAAGAKLRESARKTFTKNDDTGIYIEGAVTSLINAIHLVVDNADNTQPDVDCSSNNAEELVTKTKDIRAQRYATATTETAALLDNAPGANQKNSRYLLVDEPAEFASEDVFTSTILPDKLTLLAQGNSNYQLYVVFKAVDFLMPAADWKTFAQDVAAKSAKAKTPNTIVMVVPYYKLLCLGKTWAFTTSKGTGLLMPGVFCSDPSLQSLMNSALVGVGNTWEANFNQAFSHVPKKHYEFKYAVSYDFMVKRFESVVSTGAGHAEICDLQILVDERLQKNVDARTAIKRQMDSKEQSPEVLTRNEGILRNLPNERASAHLLKHGLKESAIIRTEGTGQSLRSIAGEQFVKWFVAGKAAEAEGSGWAALAVSLNTNVNSPDNVNFIAGVNPVVLEKYYEALDNLGLALNFAELDWLTDGAGFLIASYYRDRGNKLVYGASLAIPVGALVLRSSARGLKILKQTDTGWELVDDASALMQSIKARLLGKGWEPELIAKFENDFAGDVNMIVKFEENSGLVEVWKVLKDANVDDAIRKGSNGELEFVRKYMDDFPDRKVAEEIAEAGGYSKWVNRVTKEADLLAFVNKTITQKLEDIANAWKAVYPEVFVERKFFEDIVGHYRYSKNTGWGHTADIADNFKAIDFYDEFTEVGSDIFAKTAVSMKTTTTKSIDSWLASNAVRNNIDNLKQAIGSGTGKGITWNGKTIFYSKAEIHIYMPKDYITHDLKKEWLDRLVKDHPTIRFEINALEDFVK